MLVAVLVAALRLGETGHDGGSVAQRAADAQPAARQASVGDVAARRVDPLPPLPTLASPVEQAAGASAGATEGAAQKTPLAIGQHPALRGAQDEKVPQPASESEARTAHVAAGPPTAAERVAAVQRPAQRSGASQTAAGARAARTPGYLQTLPGLARQRTPTGVHVEAHLMQGRSSGAGQCDGGGEAGRPCSETEKSFMKDTVIGLPSGVKYKVINNGSGRSPGPGDTVLVSYRGLLPDGSEFDSSGPGGEAETFRLSQAIPGLRDALQYMEEGAKWEVYLPAEQAFPEPGPLGAQEVIFDIELVAVLDGQPPAAAASERDGEARSRGAPGSGDSYWQAATGRAEDEAGIGQAPDTAATAARPRLGGQAQAFFAQMAEKEGVVSLPSGLQYRVLKSGDGSGRSPAPSDTVVVNYRGSLPDGREIDRSEQATAFRMDELMPGWREALQHMEQGAQWELYVPPSLAHTGSTRRRGPLGMRPLIYQLELISISPSSTP